MPWSIISARFAAYVPRDGSDDTVSFGSTVENLPTDGKANLLTISKAIILIRNYSSLLDILTHA